jgi:hypothetical protein
LTNRNGNENIENTMKPKRVGRGAQWPPYYEKKQTQRTLAIIVGTSLYTEFGEQLDATTFSQLVEQLFHHNLLVFTASLTDKSIFPFLADCVQDDKTKVICNKEGKASSVRIKRKSSSRWIVPASSWDKIIDRDFMSDMRCIYNYIGVGEKPTPSSCGTSLLSQEWARNHFARIASVNGMCRDMLFQFRNGGRCDLSVAKGAQFESLVELDIASAYLAHLLRMPIGTSIRTYGNDLWNFWTFFCKCSVTITTELALGPFPDRKQKSSKIKYPTLPGTYEVHLWREQIEDCLAVGCQVTMYRGYGWHDYTEDTTSSCQRLYQLRVNAPDDDIEHAVKKVTTSAIGRFGTHNTFYSLVHEDDSLEGEQVLLNDQNRATQWHVHPEEDFTGPSMIHWYSYNMMQCARTLYRYALPYAREGRLVMTNYDAILVLEQDETHRYIQKHTLEAKMCAMGDWRWKRLTNVTIKGERSLECDQYVSLPGVKR